MLMVLLYDASHFENSPGSSDECTNQMAADPQTKPMDLDCDYS